MNKTFYLSTRKNKDDKNVELYCVAFKLTMKVKDRPVTDFLSVCVVGLSVDSVFFIFSPGKAQQLIPEDREGLQKAR